MPHPLYVKFPVIETIDLSGTSTIRQAVDRMVEAYLAQDPLGKFSYRILLPRDQKSTRNAKMIGLAFQGEFMLGLRRRNVVPNVARGTLYPRRASLWVAACKPSSV